MTLPPDFVPYATTVPSPFDRDADHLRILSILHYVWGGLTLLFSSLFIFHVVIGLAMVSGHSPFTMPPPTTAGGAAQQLPPEMGYMFVGMGGCAVACGWTLGILTIASGRRLARRRSRVFSMVVAGLNCISVPFGTTLGVFTFIVLARDSVRLAYEAAAEPSA